MAETSTPPPTPQDLQAKDQVVSTSVMPAGVTPDPNSIVDTLKSHGIDSSFNNRSVLYTKAGLGNNYQGTAEQNIALNKYYTTGDGKPQQVGIVTSNQSQNQYNANVANMNKAVATVTPDFTKGNYDYSDPNGVKFVANSSDPVLTPDNTKVPDGLDPSIKKMYQDSIDSLTNEATNAKATLDAAIATANNNPALLNAIQSIRDKYDILIKNMNEKNRIVVGSAQKNAAMSGQLINDITTNFLSNEMDRASERVAQLVSQENDLILKTQEAYKNGDVKALDEAQKAYDDVNKQKFDEINKLATATNAAVKTSQQAVKDAQTEKNQAITNDIKVSNSIAGSTADQIKNSGITDKDTIDSFINDVAESNGISNPEVLRAAVIKAQQTNTANDLKNENTRSTIAKRNQPKSTTSKPKTDGGYTYTKDDVAQGISFLEKGGKAPDGTTYGGKGETYVNTGTYITLYKNWVDENGGTPKGFLKEFPVKDYVNPDDYASLPGNIRPKASVTAAPIPQ